MADEKLHIKKRAEVVVSPRILFLKPLRSWTKNEKANETIQNEQKMKATKKNKVAQRTSQTSQMRHRTRRKKSETGELHTGSLTNGKVLC